MSMSEDITVAMRKGFRFPFQNGSPHGKRAIANVVVKNRFREGEGFNITTKGIVQRRDEKISRKMKEEIN